MATTRRRAKPPAEEPVLEEVEDGLEELDADELDDLEVEEVADPEPAPAPKRTSARKAAKSVPAKAAPAKAVRKAAPAGTDAFDSAWLADYVSEETGVAYDARGIRMLLRKLADDGLLSREVGTDRSRYTFRGPNDPTVRAVVKMVKSGAAKAVRQGGLDKVKAAKAEETPAPAPAKRATKSAPAKATKAAPVRRARAKA